MRQPEPDAERIGSSQSAELTPESFDAVISNGALCLEDHDAGVTYEGGAEPIVDM